MIKNLISKIQNKSYVYDTIVQCIVYSASSSIAPSSSSSAFPLSVAISSATYDL